MEGRVAALTELALMCFHYSVFVIGDEEFPAEYMVSKKRSSGTIIGERDLIKWDELKIIGYRKLDDRVMVEFIASYECNNRMMRLHGYSMFIRENDRWYSVDGIFFNMS